MDSIAWGYTAPAKHIHRTSGWTWVDDEVNGEMVLQCGRCETCWHTGLPVDDDYHSEKELKAAATQWLRDELLGKVTRRQLPLPLVVETGALKAPQKRNYARQPKPNYSAQLALAWAA